MEKMNNINIFLMIGQSNMAGRGKLEEVTAIYDPNILVFKKDKWIEAVEPLHEDKPDLAGAGLGMSFAKYLSTVYQGCTIGLLPCAFGGTALSMWEEGSELYLNSIEITKKALKDGSLKGILWHQGEGDSGNLKSASSYSERFTKMIFSLLKELGNPKIPIIIGELGEFLQNREDCRYFSIVNNELKKASEILPLASFVTAKDLSHNGDNLHFNSKSLREFGCRYAEKYESVIKTNNIKLLR